MKSVNDGIRLMAFSPASDMYIVTDSGRIFARIRDSQAAMNQRVQEIWKWVELAGPPIDKTPASSV